MARCTRNYYTAQLETLLGFENNVYGSYDMIGAILGDVFWFWVRCRQDVIPSQSKVFGIALAFWFETRMNDSSTIDRISFCFFETP